MSINIVVPEVGESIVDARVARWLKKEGDAVAAGEPLVELETDKIDVEVPAPKAGVLERIAHKDGDDVKIGAVIGTIKEGAAKDGAREKGPRRVRGRILRPRLGRCRKRHRPGSRNRRPATPSARKLAREQNVEIGAVKSDGPRVTRNDVEKASSPAVPTDVDAAPATARPAAPAAPVSPRPRRLPHLVRLLPRRRVPRRRRAMTGRRGARADVEAPRDDRQAPRRSPADRRDAHHVQRGGHVRGDGPPRAPQGDFKAKYGVSSGSRPSS